MRNLKKFLALVLAMVMAFSLMLGASAATFDDEHFSDTEQVTQEFKEAVAVLTGLDVIKGDGDGDIKSIRPQDTITRAEAAALVYRIVTGDINDTQVGLYSDYSNFTDVKPRSAADEGDWFAGYVGYCQNAGIIKGTTPTTFSPYLPVTGYEVLAMILRAVGYGKNNEFTGSSWQVNVASLGKTKHITDSVTSAHFNYTLNMNATREIVAELLFRGSLIPQVNWSSALGYSEYDQPLNGNQNAALAQEVFNLYPEGWSYSTWGIPQFTWKATLNPSKTRTVATLIPEASFEFHDGEQRECDVADMLDIDEETYVLWVNGSRVTNDYRIKDTDTVTRVGGWGRLVSIYLQEDMDKQFPWHSTSSYWNNEDSYTRWLDDTFVMIDTYLAKVISTTDAVLDPAGHVITPARMVVDLYDRDQNQTLRRTIEKASDSKENWEYSAGQVISLEGKSINLSTTIPAGQTDSEAWAFTLPQVKTGSSTLVSGTDVRSIKALTGVQAKQTAVYWNNGKHQVGGEDKIDDLALLMDKAGSNINTTFTWYYDEYGYLLGIDDGSAVTYGVITSVYAAFDQGESSTTGTAKAVATVKYADGTTGQETIDYFLVAGTNGGTRTTAGAVMGERTNTVQLWPLYDVTNMQPMQETAGMPYNVGDPSPVRGVARGTLWMAPIAVSNSNAATQYANFNLHGVLKNNLFKFVKSAGDKTVAIEVAGGNNSTDGTTEAAKLAGTQAIYTLESGNNGDFAGHWNATNTAGKVYKTLSYITNNTNSVVTWIDDDTQIMVRDAATGSIVCYSGVESLPGDVSISTIGDGRRYDEIDWADTDNDGRADVVYLTGSIEGVTTYGLFYSNALVASWNGTTAQIDGFLNGERTTLTFTNYSEFNKINSISGSYAGHLFAVKQVNGIVTNVMVTDWASESLGATVRLVPNSGKVVKTFGVGGAPSNGVGIDVTSAGSDDFKYGDETGYIGTNPYTATTEAVYWQDNSTTPVEYHHSTDWSLYGATVTVGGTTTYRLTPNSKVYGLGNGVVLAEGATALEYLEHSYTNDVTIVYENHDNGSYSVIEMYIQTDPNITPSVSGPAAYSRQPVTGLDDSLQVASSSTVLNSLLNGINNRVIYSPNGKAAPDAAPNSDKAQVLYFPFTTRTSGTGVLTITNIGTNQIVYTENVSGLGSSTAAYFVVNFAGGPVAASAVTPNGTGNGYAFPAGNYRFIITASNGTELSSGTFSIS